MSVCDFYVYLIIFALSPSLLYYACAHTHSDPNTQTSIGRGATWIEKRLCRVGIILFSFAVYTLKNEMSTRRENGYTSINVDVIPSSCYPKRIWFRRWWMCRQGRAYDSLFVINAPEAASLTPIMRWHWQYSQYVGYVGGASGFTLCVTHKWNTSRAFIIIIPIFTIGWSGTLLF